jgi:hypothetical protein
VKIERSKIGFGGANNFELVGKELAMISLAVIVVEISAMKNHSNNE